MMKPASGVRVSLTRALWSDFLHRQRQLHARTGGHFLEQPLSCAQDIDPNPPSPPIPNPSNVPQSILDQLGAHFYNRFGTTLAYDTRNSTQLPNHGQRTEIDPEISVGDADYYKIQLKTHGIFPA